MGPPRFSVIIPAYNEEAYLPRLLDSIEFARSRCHHDGSQVEVIVSNNASTDLTAEVAMSKGCRVALVTKRTIAAARNGGAAIAEGDIFCFIDADSAIHPETFNAIDEAVNSGRYVGGATGIYLERMSPGILVSNLALLPIAWLTGMDTGLVFCRRSDFLAISGYDEDMLYAEDVRFLWSLRKLGRSRGQKLVRLTRFRALGSTRKFDQHGDWHYFAMTFEFLLGWLSGRKRDREIADRYWYKPQR